jgi:hypothetical protein
MGLLMSGGSGDLAGELAHGSDPGRELASPLDGFTGEAPGLVVAVRRPLRRAPGQAEFT